MPKHWGFNSKCENKPSSLNIQAPFKPSFSTFKPKTFESYLSNLFFHFGSHHSSLVTCLLQVSCRLKHTYTRFNHCHTSIHKNLLGWNLGIGAFSRFTLASFSFVLTLPWLFNRASCFAQIEGSWLTFWAFKRHF